MAPLSSTGCGRCEPWPRCQNEGGARSDVCCGALYRAPHYLGSLFMRAARVLALWFGLACVPPLRPSMEFVYPIPPSFATDQGALQAAICAGQEHLSPKRPYASLRLYLVRGTTFDLQGHWSPGHDYAYSGYTIGGAVYVAEGRKDLVAIWAHEFIHAIYGLPGKTAESHPPTFARCGLDTI